jgi:uncharacterized caspase-like protein
MSRYSCLRPLAFCLSAIALCASGMLAAMLLAGPAAAEKRVALVIGNSAYVHTAQLLNPVNDANEMAAALKEVGVEVILGLDLDKRDLDGKVREFSRALLAADAGILFYAGHGLQVGQRNYLVPVDARLQSERDLDFETVAVDFILRQMELDRAGKTNILFFDACRDNPLARNLRRAMATRSASVGQGLAEVKADVGTFVAYATKYGEVALDGEGRNSPFTAALSKAVRAPGRSLTTIMIEVRKDVLAATGGKQVPWDHSALTGEFYFNLAAAPSVLPKTAPPAPQGDSEAMRERLKELEEELKRKADPQQTAKLIELAQLRERVRQLEEASRQDQQLIHETYRKHGPVSDPAGRATLNREIGTIQLRIGQRVQQARTLRERIGKLEAEVGLVAQGTK